MSSPLGTSQHSDGSRAAGGTSTSDDIRTSRRVQWAGNDNVRVNGNSNTSPRQSIHELDEMAIDVRSCLSIIHMRRS